MCLRMSDSDCEIVYMKWEQVREKRESEAEEFWGWGGQKSEGERVCGAGSRQFQRGPTQARRPVGQGSAGGKPEPSMRLIENR